MDENSRLPFLSGVSSEAGHTYGSGKYRTESGKMLAASYLFQQGTPFIYKGQEIGMTNISLPAIDDYKDVAANNNYKKYIRYYSEDLFG